MAIQDCIVALLRLLINARRFLCFAVCRMIMIWECNLSDGSKAFLNGSLTGSYQEAAV
mgnify:CR=1